MTPHPPIDALILPTEAISTSPPGDDSANSRHLTPINPRYMWVIRAHIALNALFLLLLASSADYFLAPRLSLPQGIATGVITFAMLLFFLIVPVRRVASIRYHLADDHIRIRRGFLFTVDSIVPFVRVQHIDVSQGVIERSLGLASLSIHTSGVRNDAVTLPGLDALAAHEMRDIIHRHILTDFA